MRTILPLPALLMLSTALAGAPGVNNLRVTTTPSGAAVKALRTDTPKVYVLADVNGTKGAAAQVVWIAESVGAGVPPNTEIDRMKLGLPVTSGRVVHNTLTFSLSRPTAGWPKGHYRADLYVAPAPGANVPARPTASIGFDVR
ncbi:hypothetical protein [Deinococcus hopiensis]|uniref:Uncharacterized protein n=1 Tax=Deinococcus hopiensis KR-140 TaxID=695939 RepID=A0A1W1UQ11_9DEIO|nr:hypothetical protein [Deinococcus hopiensis]SMB83156.1 hypothetical protein SAMN00790413_04283 [Deinococcus hopiensis KR-140]